MGLNHLPQLAKHLTHPLGGGHDDVHQLGRQFQFTVAQTIEQVFSQVAQGDQFRRIEETGTALDGMKPPENIVEQAPVIRHLLKINQFVIDIG